MTITNLYTDILKNVAQAQYNAYVYAQQLGEQAAPGNLFPIPIAEVKEITLDINYAFAKPPQPAIPQTSIVPATVFNNLKPLFVQAISKARRQVIDEIDTTDASADAGWLAVKRNLLQGTLDQYALTTLRQQFLSNARQIIRNGKIDPQQLVQLLINNTDDTFIQHADMKKYIRAVPARYLAKQAVEETINNNLQQLQQAAEGATQNEDPDLEIIIDTDGLQKIPAEAIQHARVVLDLRSILNENNQQP